MKSITLLALLGVAASLGTTQKAWAQAAPAAKSEAKANLHYFRLKNVAPSLMAYWLDPKNNPLPNNSHRGTFTYGSLGPQWPDATVSDEKEAPKFKIPASVGRATASNADNFLSVEVGEADAIPLRKLIAALDEPVRQIEIEAQFVELDTADLEKFGVVAELGQGKADANGGFIRNNLTARLNALIANDRAKIITAPRVSAYDNVIAQFGYTYGSGLPPTFDPATQKVEFSDNKMWFNIKPMINPDDSLTVQYRIFRQPVSSAIEKSSSSEISGISDGQTFLIRDSLLNSKSDPKSKSETVVFVTARIIRPNK